jgi:hypothetical protein
MLPEKMELAQSLHSPLRGFLGKRELLTIAAHLLLQYFLRLLLVEKVVAQFWQMMECIIELDRSIKIL